jgi:DNA-binding cell septation regulator SpoVG
LKGNKKMKTLAEIKIGDTFKVADIEFIKFADENGQAIAVAKDAVFHSEFGDNNNFAESKVKNRLESEILPKIEKVVGAENIIEHEVDLLSLDGDDKWGKARCKISIPTFDFYRHNVKMFDNYKLNAWWWLATPDTTAKHYNDNWAVCVSPRGFMGNGIYIDVYAVRPFIIFVSSISVISVSCEE